AAELFRKQGFRNRELTVVQRNLADVLLRLHRRKEAEAILLEADKRYAADASIGPGLRADVKDLLGQLRVEQDRLPDAVELYREGLEQARKAPHKDRGSMLWRVENLANLMARMDRHAESAALFDEQATLAEKLRRQAESAGARCNAALCRLAGGDLEG